MSSKKPKDFKGLSELTSARLRKKAGEQNPFDEALGLSPDGSLQRELGVLGSIDPYDAAKDAHGREPTDEEHVRATNALAALIQARLEKRQDFHSGLSVDEAEAFFPNAGFKLAYEEGVPGQGDRHEIWAMEETGIVVVGAPYKSDPHDYHLFFQWTPDRKSLTNVEEGTLQSNLKRALGFGNFGFGLFNPDRPLLTHQDLHFSTSYPELTAEETQAWAKDSNAAPAWVDRERGQWIFAVRCNVRLGLFSTLASIDNLDGRFIAPWKSGVAAKFMVRECLGAFDGDGVMERRLDGCTAWFKRMIGDALIDPEKAQECLMARKKIRLVPRGPRQAP